ncbi:methyltransferase family protein [Roseiarcus fermentans]|uniref:Methyltransferase family protein n=2 Tax=Roseiarcus fermentans TaxID=1473586 RepID=A0A366F0W4_9HYPH|nr:methyltransferase family protein [Roseiarcus fermentans]
MCGASPGRSKVLGMRLDRSIGRWPRAKRGIAVSVCRCGVCGLVYSDPQPQPRSVQDHYGIPPETYWRSITSEVPESYFASQIAIAKRLVHFTSGMSALDIGVGLGNATVQLSRAGFHVHGVEPSTPFRSFALERTGLSADRIRNASIETAEFQPSSFDFITFGAVLEHLYDPAGCLARAMRWLKPDGILHVEVPSSDHLISKLINLYFKAAGSSFVTNLSPMHSPFHLYEFTRSSFVLNGAGAGYEVVESAIDVCSIYHFPRWSHGLLRKIMVSSDTGMQLTVWLKKRRR